jgi:hypothetical protein
MESGRDPQRQTLSALARQTYVSHGCAPWVARDSRPLRHTRYLATVTDTGVRRVTCQFTAKKSGPRVSPVALGSPIAKEGE